MTRVTEGMTTTREEARRLAKVSEELLRIRDEVRDGAPVQLRVWEFESLADRKDGEEDSGPDFGVDEPDPQKRDQGLVHIGAKLHLEGVDGWAHLSLDLAEETAVLDRESYLDPDHCRRTRVPFSLEDGYGFRGKTLDDAAAFAREVVRALREELEELGRLQAREEAG